MTDKDWENRFDQLMSLHLIDVPDDYYDDELKLKDPNELKQIFDKMEQTNLKNIGRTQENEHAFEIQCEIEQKLRKENDKKYVT